jgi:antirestriction protein
MKIAITDLSDYNGGKLRFEWLDVEGMDADDIEKAVQSFLDKADDDEIHEEWFISDYDDFPNLGEYVSFEEVADVIELLDEAEKAGIDREVVKAYADNMGAWNFDIDALQEAFEGVYDDEEDFAYRIIEDCGMLDQMPENLRSYFDYAKFGQDLFYSGDYWQADVSGGQIAVFRNI